MSKDLENEIIVIDVAYEAPGGNIVEKVSYKNNTGIEQVFYDTSQWDVHIPPGKTKTWLRNANQTKILKKKRNEKI